MNPREKAGLILFILGLVAIIAIIVTKQGSIFAIILSFLAMICGGLVFVLGDKK
jgi:hypothetical protein